MLTPQDIASSETVSNLKLSGDASHVVYCVGPSYKAGDHSTSALWLAETSTENSTRKITSGLTHDHSPSFHPISSDIYFLSDRLKAGGPSQIYKLSLHTGTADGSEPSVVTSLNASKTITSYSISPDGNYIGFISQDHPDPKAKEAITIWRDKTKLGSLHLLDLRKSTEGVRTLVSVDSHVESFSWSPDSSSIIYRLQSLPDEESRFFPATEAIISIDSGDVHDSFEYVRMPGSPTIWRQCGDLVFEQTVSPAQISSSKSIWTRPTAGHSAPTHIAYGDTEDASNMIDLGVESQYAVGVATGLNSRFDVFDSKHTVFTAFETSDDAAADWDMKLTDDGRYVFVVVRSSGVTGEPTNIWCGVTKSGKRGALSTKLSSHHSWFSPDKAPISKPFYWKSSDGESLQGVLIHPRGSPDLKSLPTVVVPHGGPYGRDGLELYFGCTRWGPFLASQGYLVLSPNYRGSLGRGDEFAKAAKGGMGNLDWADVDTMIDEGISQGLIDPDRLGIAGYSQGGFLTAWGCTRPHSRFKVGVVGAGVSDWGFLAASSDVPDMEANLGGGAPWVPGDPVYLRGSPIRDVKNVRVPLLILHGKEDKRVPVTQAIALLRGIERESPAAIKPKLVIYPREDHQFQERAHAEDILRRLVEHLDLYLK